MIVRYTVLSCCFDTISLLFCRLILIASDSHSGGSGMQLMRVGMCDPTGRVLRRLPLCRSHSSEIRLTLFGAVQNSIMCWQLGVWEV